jgi:sarcosine oxidase
MDFDYIVVGRGLMGSAAARHLVNRGVRVALIGPGEPPDRQTHTGVFASYYDEGRITRIIDPDINWGRFAQRSLARYRPLEDQTGVTFYQEVGALAVGQTSGQSRQYLDALIATAETLGTEIQILDRAALKAQFPYFQFYEDALGIWQPHQAGYISPRKHQQAQCQAVKMDGGTLFEDTVLTVRPGGSGIIVKTSAQILTAEVAIVATGGFTNAAEVLPRQLPITVQAHTVVLAEVDEADRSEIAAMPSLISKPNDDNVRFYLLPPILYPDGHWYIKIGCPQTPPMTTDLPALQAWFKGQGDADVADLLKKLLRTYLPEVPFRSLQVDTCVTTHTPSGYPLIDFVGSPAIVSLVGGNGYAGKSADELGHIAAEFAYRGQWRYDVQAELFQIPKI